MIEILLLSYLLWQKFKLKKVVEEEIDFLRYNPGLISFKEIDNGIKEMEKNMFQAAMLIYTQILSLLNDKTVIQIQMYGLGRIWKTEILDPFSSGGFQLAVAFKLASKFRTIFPNLTMTSQDPVHLASEIEYLQHQNVHVFEHTTFSSSYFQNALSECNVSNPIMICYMIHFPIFDFEDFLKAHWNPEILSKIIFVGNMFNSDTFSENISECKKITEFFKFIKSKALPFIKPLKIKKDPKDLWGYHPFHGHPSDFLAWKGFYNTDIYMISYEDAVKMITRAS